MPWPKGKPKSPEHKAKISATLKGKFKGATRAGWKGEAAGYMAKHNWVRRERGPASLYPCDDCGGPAREWANVSGQYLRDLADYVPLCKSCHNTRDGIVANLQGAH